jgi:competence protein ComEA
MKMRSAALALLLATGIAQAEEAAEGVNINEADSQTMAAELDGVGPVKAEAIIDFREKEGDFVTPEHLEEVNGIGTATLDSNRERIRVD